MPKKSPYQGASYFVNMKPHNIEDKLPVNPPRNDNFIVTNLMAELAISLNDKVKLENENSMLQLELEDKQRKLMQANCKLSEERSKFNEALSKLETEVKNKDLLLQNKEVEKLEDIKEYLSQV